VIFVSYSHEDEKWRKRFEIMSKPLSRVEGIEFWSDRDLQVGKWEPQIEKAMREAVVAVLLASDNFLASDFIVDKELPYLLREHDRRGLMIIWSLLQPCDLKRHPQIKEFQAMTLGKLEPMSKMTEWQWKATMLRGCDMIDEFLKKLEVPVINPGLKGKSLPRVAESLELLSKPARRRIEVLVYSPDRKWWRQAFINKGKKTTKVHLGNDKTKKGTPFNIVAMTTEQPLKLQTYSYMPKYRTKSEVTVTRG
jgi:hypothetical protein